MAETLEIRFDDHLQDPRFDPAHIVEAREDLKSGVARVIGFYVGNFCEMSVVLVKYETFLHVQEVVGKISKHVETLDRFTQAYAKLLGKSKITVCARRKAVARIAKIKGYVQIGQNEFEKVI